MLNRTTTCCRLTRSTAAALMRGPCVTPCSSPLPRRSADTLAVRVATKASCTRSWGVGGWGAWRGVGPGPRSRRRCPRRTRPLGTPTPLVFSRTLLPAGRRTVLRSCMPTRRHQPTRLPPALAHMHEHPVGADAGLARVAVAGGNHSGGGLLQVCVPWVAGGVTSGMRRRVKWRLNSATVLLPTPLPAAPNQPTIAGTRTHRLPTTHPPTRIFEDDEGCVAAQLQAHAFDSARRPCRQLLAHRGAAGEPNLADLCVGQVEAGAQGWG